MFFFVRFVVDILTTIFFYLLYKGLRMIENYIFVLYSRQPNNPNKLEDGLEKWQ